MNASPIETTPCATTDIMVVTWDAAARVASIRYEPGAQLTSREADVLIDAVGSWVGTDRRPFAILADAAGRLRAVRPELRILYMSGYTADASVHQGGLEPGAAFLPKPLTPDALARKVRAVLDEPRSPSA